MKKPMLLSAVCRSMLFSAALLIPLAYAADVPESPGMLVLASANTFIFSPRTHSWIAVNDRGQVVRSGRASGGRHYCPDIRRGCRTPSGTYTIHSKGGPDCRSSRYPVGQGGAKMPYCMFFSRYYAIHGSDDVPNYNASHGCIRVQPSDARWLSQHFIHIGSRVVVKPY